MARGDVTVFNEAKAKMLDGDWASTDDFWVGLVTNAVVPAAGDTTPVFGDYTQCTPGGNYATGGQVLDSLADLVTQAAGVMKFGDILTTSTWAQNASNPTNAYYAIVYNYTDAGKDAVAFVDLGGPVDMTAGDLTITWNASGIFTVT
jgi:hypothetical protein